MNILHIATYLQGGAGLAIAELACAQSLAGHKVSVVTSLTSEPDYFSYPQWLDRLSSAGVNLLAVDSTFKRDLALNIAALRGIRGKLDCGDLSFIHTHAAVPSMLALLVRSGIRHHIPVLQTMHGWGVRKNAAQSATDVILMNELDRVVTASEASRRLMESLGVEPQRLAVVPYGIGPVLEAGPGPDLRRLRDWKARGLVVLICIGSVGLRKNQRMIVQALASGHAPANLACAIVGEGEDIPELASLAEHLGVQERLSFFGYQPEGYRFLNAADWLILPSLDEGLPLSVLEACRAGVPVLGSDIPEITEAVSPGETGLLFNARELDSLVGVLHEITSMPEENRRAMGEMARRRWKEKYSLEIMLSRYDTVYRELLEGKAGTGR